MLEPRTSKTIRPVPLPARASRLTESGRRLDAIGLLIHRISYCPSPGHRHPCRLACRRAGRYDEPHKIGWRDEGRDGKRGDNRIVNIVCFPTGVVLCASAPWYIGDGGEGRIPYEAPSSEYMRPVLLAAGRDGQTKRNRISPRLSTRATGRYSRLGIGNTN